VWYAEGGVPYRHRDSYFKFGIINILELNVEKIIFIAIIAAALIYLIVRVYYKIKMLINLSNGKPGDSCCNCSSCPMSDQCGDKSDDIS
jgi:hypothetical protein